MKGYTDYPFIELGDTPHQEAPVRECIILSYDNNKYADIIVEGKKFNIKAGYIYGSYGRCGEVKPIDMKLLNVEKDIN